MKLPLNAMKVYAGQARRPRYMRIDRATGRPQLPDQGFQKEVLTASMPQGAGEWALELGMEGLGALAAWAYGGPGAAAEEFALGVGGSTLGRLAGSAAARGLFRGHGVGAMRGALRQGAMVGGLAGGFGGSMFGPRPITDAMRQEQEAQWLNEQEMRDQWLISQALGSPALQNYNALLGGGHGSLPDG